MSKETDESLLKIDWWTARILMQKQLMEEKRAKQKDIDYATKWKARPLGDELLH